MKGNWQLLKPAPGLCPECAVKHDVGAPHNKDSLYYQTSFKLKNGRSPTWKDAMSHCDKETQRKWKIELKKHGINQNYSSSLCRER